MQPVSIFSLGLAFVVDAPQLEGRGEEGGEEEKVGGRWPVG